ncbi:SpoIIE family protein phosphatase [Actinokineospora auranticolor]|uniref:Anti-anti-sigma factor n=1 Tax=Actinokineospora auranticolor TaxID=155976 RepID=A0A2S6GJM7_9PSEU|nr:SpoIIE family protein phosphatase [Actinokineospora auranticolor]PPK65403.1 anti-anti-sigma factor [Actinokineospora auranticolor]
MSTTSPDEQARLLDGLPLILWEADAVTGRVTSVSEQAEALLGHPAARWLAEPGFWVAVVHPDDRAACLRARAAAEDYELDFRVVTADGRVRWLHDVVHVVRDDDGAPRRLRGVSIDVTARRAAEERERFLVALERELQSLEDAEEIMAVATRRLGEHLGADRCAYARAEADEDHFVMSGDYASGLPSLPGRFAMSAFGAGAVAAMRAGAPWVVADSLTDPRLADPCAYETTGIRAVVCVPLLKSGRFVAAMAVHQATVRQWTQDEVDTVVIVAGRLWESLQRAHSGRALRDSERRYRLLFERATDGIWIVDDQLRYVEANAAGCALFGYTREELLGRTVHEFISPNDADRLASMVSKLAAGHVVTEVWDIRRADGAVVSLELSIQATPTGLQAIGRDVTARQRAEAERELVLQREHEIAAALQRSLLPRELPRLARLATAARYLPAARYSQAGGDWYEVLPLTDTVVALSVGDVVGKGPTAAAIMGQLRSALAGYLLDGHTPAAALERLDAFASRTNGAIGSTCACLTFDWSTGILRWALAGHPPPLLVEPHGPRYLFGTSGAVLGVPGRAPYRDNTEVLVPGTSAVLYTDGLVERPGSVIDVGFARLAEVVRTVAGLGPDALTALITDTMLDGGHGDDVAVVVARYIPPPLTYQGLPANPAELPALRVSVDSWAVAAGLSQELRNDLHLALGEAAANAVEHAYPDGGGDFDVDLAHTGEGAVEVRVRDRGRWRPEPEVTGHRGRGLGLIRALADSVAYDQTDDGTTVEFRIAGTAGPRPGFPAADHVEHPVPARTIRLAGALDLAGAAALRETLLGQAARGEIAVDLTAVDYLSSSGVALLLDTASALTGSRLVVTVTAGGAPERILALSGIGEVLDIRVG